MLLAHNIGDGNVVKGKGNRMPFFSYRQYNQYYKILYINKIEAVFGKLNYYNKNYANRNNTTVSCPAILSALIFKLYTLDTDSFKTEIARIPHELFVKDSKNKLAFLIGIIIDEGHVDSDSVIIIMKNQNFIKDLKILCDKLGYENTMRLNDNNYGTIYILSKGLSKFYKDYLILLNEYPEVDLGYKGKLIEEFISRINKPKIYRPGNKSKIVNLLAHENLTVNELATRLRMTRQGARYLIHKLVKEDKVEVKSIVKFANWKYGLRVNEC
jgi:hypothetical protein